MRVFVFYTDDDSPEPDSGFVRAETPEEALALLGHPEAAVVHLPADAEWPGEPGERIQREIPSGALAVSRSVRAT